MSGIGITPESAIREASRRLRICDCPYDGVSDRDKAVAWERGVNHAKLAVKDAILDALRKAKLRETEGAILRLGEVIEEALDTR